MAKAVLIVALASLLSMLPSSSLALTQDSCVADLNNRDTPAGYPCRRPTPVNADELTYLYDGLATPGPEISPFDIRVATAFVDDFPAVNGLDISAGRVDMAPGGVVPLHTHPRGTELLYVLDGTMEAGFISSTGNTVYKKKLNKGDLFVFPVGLLHFQYNSGNKTAVAIAAYSSPSPGMQIFDFAMFKSKLPTDVVSKITFLQPAEVKRLKKLFGGSG